MSEAAHLAHITHYRILTGTDPDRMSEQVETAIHDGWQPFGSLSAFRDADGRAAYAQPLVRYAEWFR